MPRTRKAASAAPISDTAIIKKRPKSVGRGGELSQRVDELFELSQQRKELEKQESALKAWFRSQAGGKDMTFENGARQVIVSTEERRSLDQEAVMLKLGQTVFNGFMRATPYVKVTTREKPEAA